MINRKEFKFQTQEEADAVIAKVQLKLDEYGRKYKKNRQELSEMVNDGDMEDTDELFEISRLLFMTSSYK